MNVPKSKELPYMSTTTLFENSRLFSPGRNFLLEKASAKVA